MGDRYAVDVAAMEVAVSGIQRTVDGVVVTPVRAIAPSVQVVGEPRLAEALSEFCTRWEVGVGSLCRDAEELVKRLQESAIGYETAEQKVTSSAGGSTTAVRAQ